MKCALSACAVVLLALTACADDNAMESAPVTVTGPPVTVTGGPEPVVTVTAPARTVTAAPDEPSVPDRLTSEQPRPLRPSSAPASGLASPPSTAAARM